MAFVVSVVPRSARAAASPARDEGRTGALLFAARRAVVGSRMAALACVYWRKRYRAAPHLKNGHGPPRAQRIRRGSSRTAVISAGRRLLASVLQALAPGARGQKVS